ncbi:hypothetical protein [Rhizobium sp. EC-SD404]|uniref:hypothetical protein n=1 Tax=Rhizobium sp. EC-SD404 TaxID=2038389 RepID=UPI001250E2BA|nr:hypothetical protein [Rhizobium sp. EC-SD404]VVT32001.1 hypothetical protein RHIZ404_230460 [Rhizobium sp. EC-SD404]
MNQRVNLFEGRWPEQSHEVLKIGKADPKWPSDEFQPAYIDMQGPGLVRRAFAFIDILHMDGAFNRLEADPSWSLEVVDHEGTSHVGEGCSRQTTKHWILR